MVELVDVKHDFQSVGFFHLQQLLLYTLPALLMKPLVSLDVTGECYRMTNTNKMQCA